MRLWLHGCPRCGGNLADDGLDGYTHCLACGHYLYQPIPREQADRERIIQKGLRLPTGPRTITL